MSKLKSCLAILSSLLLAQSAFSQQTQTSRLAQPQAMIFGQRVTDLHETPVASFTAGYLYTFTDSQNGHNKDAMGWSAMPAVHLTRHIELQGDFAGLYERGIYPGQNRLSLTAGPRFTFAPRSRFTPFVYGEGGEIRMTSQYSSNSDWNPVVRGGIGVEHKITRGLAFQFIPGEYTGQLLDNHEVEHSFTARAGITFNLYK